MNGVEKCDHLYIIEKESHIVFYILIVDQEKKLRKVYFSIFSLFLFLLASGCGTGQAFSSTITPPSTITPIPTITPTQTATPIPTPPVEVGLSKVNASEMVIEDGVWVTKNAQGKITATWNAETNTWVYSPENIKIKFDIIGFAGHDKSLLNPLLQPLPPDSPENHIMDPKTGEPLPYGYYTEIMAHGIESATGKIVDFPEAVFAVRNRGIIKIDETYFALGFEMPISHDRSVLFILTVTSEQYFTELLFRPANIMEVYSIADLNHGKFLPEDISGQFIQSIRGQQVMIRMNHNTSEVKCPGSEFVTSACAKGDQVLAFIKNPAIGVPEIPMWIQYKGMNYLVPTVILPESLALSSPNCKIMKFFVYSF